mgnify:CR=1 FL=1|tara:strand:- start:488 stop:718 length:231 start_codon:yes stop_codon:yes gene_type:complete
MATVFKPKRSFTASSVPALNDLERGELAINTADKKIYVRDESGGNTPANDQVVLIANYEATAASIDDAIVFAIALG